MSTFFPFHFLSQSSTCILTNRTKIWQKGTIPSLSDGCSGRFSQVLRRLSSMRSLLKRRSLRPGGTYYVQKAKMLFSQASNHTKCTRSLRKIKITSPTFISSFNLSCSEFVSKIWSFASPGLFKRLPEIVQCQQDVISRQQLKQTFREHKQYRGRGKFWGLHRFSETTTSIQVCS